MFPPPAKPVEAAGPGEVSPVERELVRAVDDLKQGMEQLDNSLGILSSMRRNVVSVQTDDMLTTTLQGVQEAPVGYSVPKNFVRAAAEACEQAVVTYCPLLVTNAEREKGVLRLMHEIAQHLLAPRHLYFEIFEPSPVWYDYVKISVFDCITAAPLGAADLVPPTVKVVIANVNVPLYESAVVTEESIPHLPQVEISLLKFAHEDQNRVVAQSVTVPLDLFVTSNNILLTLDDGTEREISYKAALVSHDIFKDN